ncbi:hypothetical protein [Mycobacterium riyadhense]|uniref:Uncharacterized protein n=1 Tax=Mycobacterium riyadhense TaxID=486698 RepID=A0A653EZJ9_9MYCO|nr:hypothetical protein [Mycobacterium riyadhense]VTP02808.1 hypothetical protein BIN_B_04705 [Mycobacterium riyadhense]
MESVRVHDLRNKDGEVLDRYRGRLVAIALVAMMPAIAVSAVLAGRSAADPGCANGQSDASPTGKGQQVIVDYFKAVNNQDYAKAWGYLGRPMRAAYGAKSPAQDANGLSSFSSIMRRHLKCVRVTTVASANATDPDVSASLGLQWYQVTFDAEHITPFEPGVATLPPFYKTLADPHEPAPPPLIINQATSL